MSDSKKNRGSRTFGRFQRLTLKELREILRDRRTIITLVLMPVLVYPLLSLVIQRFMLTSAASAMKKADEGDTFILGFESNEQAAMFFEPYNRLANPARQGETSDNQESNPAVAPGPGETERDSEFVITDAFKDVKLKYKLPGVRDEDSELGLPTLEELVARREIDVGIRAKHLAQPDRFWNLDFEFIYIKGDGPSEDALKYISTLFYEKNQQALQDRLRQFRVPSGRLITQRFKPLKTKSALNRTASLATIIPLILTLMTITGAVYPAIDLTAGERERGTLETLIATPIPRMGILMGKFVAVFTVALLTAMVNMIGMMITIWAFRLDRLVFGEQGISIIMIPQVLGLVLLFAGFFSAVLLAVTSFARSFKEAQAYLIPLMLISLTPGIVALMPDIKLTGLLVVTPLINIVLLARDILMGEGNWSTAMIGILSTIIYGFVAISFAARIFGTDAILFGHQNGWQSFIKRPKSVEEVCSLPGAFLCLALLLPANFIWLGLMQRGPDGTGRIWMMIAGTMLLYAVFPLAYMYWKRVSFTSGLGLRVGKKMAYPAAILIGCATGVLLIQIYASYRLIVEFVSATGEEERNYLTRMMVDMGRKVVEDWKQSPRVLVLLALSIVPAACEELFFRGMLFRSLQKVTPVLSAIIVSGVMFGLFHTLSANILSVDRFIPSALIGFVLAIVAYRSQSLLPGIILHTIHNLIIVNAALFHDTLVTHHMVTPEQQSLPIGLVFAAVGFALVGFFMLPRKLAAGENPVDR